MAENTVAALNAKYIADSTEFTKGLGEVDRALRRTKQIQRDAETPMTRYERKIQDITINLREGKITQEQAIRATDKANKSYERATKGAKNYQSSLAKMAIAGAKIALVLGTVRRVVTGLTRRLKELADAGRRARVLGLTLRQLEGLRDVGQDAGMSLNGTTQAIQRIIRRVGEFENATGEAKKTLEAMGISVAMLRNLDEFDRIKLITGRMSQLNTATEKLTVGFKLFDSEGAGLASVLADLGEGPLQDLIDKQGQLGVLSQQELENVTRTQQAYEEFGKTFNNIINRGVAVASETYGGFVGILQDVAEAFNLIMTVIKPVFKLWARVRFFTSPLLNQIRAYAVLGRVIKSILKPLQPLFDRIKSIFAKIRQITSGIVDTFGEKIMDVFQRWVLSPLWKRLKIILLGVERQLIRIEQLFQAMVIIGIGLGVVKPNALLGKAAATTLEVKREGTAAVGSLQRGSSAAFSFLQAIQRERFAKEASVQEQQLDVQRQIAANTSPQTRPNTGLSGAVPVG